MAREIIFFKSHVENKVRRLVPDLFLLFEKALYEVKASGLHLSYNIFRSQLLNYWSRDILNFNFLEKGLAIVSPPHFVYDFSRKMFLMFTFY